MNNSPTEDEQTSTGLENQPTGQEQVQQTSAEQSNQDTNSREQSQGKVSDDTAQQNQNPQGDGQKQKQTQQQGSATQTDDGLAKFAKSQGFDLETASDDVKRALKIAHDNQKAFRSNTPSKSISDATEGLGDGSLEAEVAQLKYERQTDKFWQGENRDRSLEPTMVEILNEKAEQYGKEYAFILSRDLDTLYGIAQLKSGAQPNANVDVEAIRREERESINRQLQGGAPQAHAVQGGQAKTPEITAEWLTNEYDSRNPEHIKLLQEAGLR